MAEGYTKVLSYFDGFNLLPGRLSPYFWICPKCHRWQTNSLPEAAKRLPRASSHVPASVLVYRCGFPTGVDDDLQPTFCSGQLTEQTIVVNCFGEALGSLDGSTIVHARPWHQMQTVRLNTERYELPIIY